MGWLNTLMTVIQLLAALAIVILVLLQHGKGADMGAAFGSGSSGSLFGASGSANFLSRTTAVLAAIFFASTLTLAYLGSNKTVNQGGVLSNMPASSVPASVPPAAPATTTQPAATQNQQIPAVPAQAEPKTNEIPK